GLLPGLRNRAGLRHEPRPTWMRIERGARGKSGRPIVPIHLPGPRQRTQMRLYRRALSYYRPELRKLAFLLSLNITGILLALAAPWPLAVAMDSLFNHAPAGPVKDWAHGLLLGLLPSSIVGAVVGLALITLLIRLAQELLKVATTMTQHSLNYGVLLRVRRDLFAKVQSMTPVEHGRLPEGDAVYRLCYDAAGPSSIVNTF